MNHALVAIMIKRVGGRQQLSRSKKKTESKDIMLGKQYGRAGRTSDIMRIFLFFLFPKNER